MAGGDETIENTTSLPNCNQLNFRKSSKEKRGESCKVCLRITLPESFRNPIDDGLKNRCNYSLLMLSLLEEGSKLSFFLAKYHS